MGIFAIIVDYLQRGSGGILATVIQRTGSAPRDVGAKMFIAADGTMFGTVGGGRLESDAYNKALEIMNKGITALLSVNMEAMNVEDADMLCGGNVYVLLEPVTTGSLELYSAIRHCRERREAGVLLTRFGDHGFAKTLLCENGTTVGDFPDYGTGKTDFFSFDLPALADSGDLFVEPIRAISPLYIFGAGHISQHLSRMAKAVGFYVTVIDDRREFANTERFSDTDSIIVGEFADTFCALEFTGHEYVVICTRSHEYDALVLENALKKETKYIGMIGSARKVRIIMDRMHAKGYDQRITAGVRAPIGIPINAETPQEIAVSIVAQLIQVKNAQSRGSGT